jgi:probable blue pigment (indigoidine) exporter
LTGEATLPRPPLRGVLLALAATAFWALGSILTKHSLIHFSPLTLLAVELGASNCVLLAAVLVTARAHPSGRELARLSLPGLLQPGLAYSLSFVGLKWMNSVSIETLVWSAEGVIMLPFSVLFLREKVSLSTLGLGGIALSGIGLVSLPPGLPPGHSSQSLAGTTLVVGSVLAACWYTVLAQRDLRRNDPLLLTTLHHVSGFLLVLAIQATLDQPEGHFATLSLASYGEATIAGLSLFGIPFCLYLRSLQLIGSARAAQFLPIVPVLTVLLALSLLHEALAPVQVLGGAITIVAVFKMAINTTQEGDKEHPEARAHQRK